jgi:hypothetical protein
MLQGLKFPIASGTLYSIMKPMLPQDNTFMENSLQHRICPEIPDIDEV